MSEDAWNDLVNAETYAEFTRRWPVYSFLNEALTDSLLQPHGPWPDLKVLDLGCGTGATAEALLTRLGPRAEIRAVDRADAMVRLAKDLLPDPRVRFEVLAAESLQLLEGGPFDAAISNAAFWHFRGNPLAKLAPLLRPFGELHFTVPAAYVSGERAEAHPVQAALARQLAESHEALPAAIAPLSRSNFASEARHAGFSVPRWQSLAYASRQGEFMDLLRIPAMSDWIAPDLAPSQREQLLDQAWRHLDPDDPVTVTWFLVSLVRQPEPDDGPG